MALPTTVSAQGATIALGTSSWTAGVLGISVDGQERAVKSVTNLSTTGYMQFKPGSLVNPGTLPVRFQFDPDTPPPITAVAETITLTFPTPAGGISGATLIGTGFIASWSADGNGGDEEEMTGELTIQWDGNTAPAWTAST